MQIDDPPVGRGHWVEKSKTQIFQDWVFWGVLESEFLKSGDASSTYLTQSSASSDYLTKSSASSTYLTQSNASSTYATKTELSGKQNTIPNFTLISTQTMYGLSVKVYSDGLSVYVSISGNLNGNSNIPTGGSIGNLGTLSNTSYAPHTAMQSPVHVANNPSKIVLTSGGVVRLMNGSTSNTYEIQCSFYYPLKSRIP